mgnify:CR=1 FL=1
MEKTLKEKLIQAPVDSGVYQFYNSKKKIIYIGKAKNIRNRIRTYFQRSKNQSTKTTVLVKHIHSIDWIVVRNEVEALMTEAYLIKKYQPRYNIALKDDKSYPFIRITNEPYPQVFITRNIIKDGSKYYGPFTDSRRLRMILKALNKIFPIRSCSYFIDKKVIEQKKISICLDYHIKKCEGPCEGFVTKERYNEMIMRIEDFIKGKTKKTLYHIKELMINASKNQNFEEAAIFRDQISAIESFKNKQSQVATDFKERDVIVFVKDGGIGLAVVLRIRNGKIFSRDKLYLKQLTKDNSTTLKTIITRFYMDSDYLPQEISLEIIPSDETELLLWLKIKNKRKVKFLYPKKGVKAKEIRVALQNAKLLFGEWIINRKKNKEHVPRILEQLKNDLSLDVPPRKIEAFDISHLGGTNTVASMVSFVDGKPKKSEYRKYKIKSVKGIDDFASIREVVLRRYKRVRDEKISLPELILVDGGKGQLSMALSALREIGMDFIPIIGLAKKLEEIFIPGSSEPQIISKTSPSLTLLMRIRDEAHRFAISFHKEKRKKDLTKSIFLDIKGLGQKRIRTLLQLYNGPKEISKSTPKTINSKTKIPIKIAKKIIDVAKINHSSIKKKNR